MTFQLVAHHQRLSLRSLTPTNYWHQANLLITGNPLKSRTQGPVSHRFWKNQLVTTSPQRKLWTLSLSSHVLFVPQPTSACQLRKIWTRSLVSLRLFVFRLTTACPRKKVLTLCLASFTPLLKIHQYPNRLVQKAVNLTKVAKRFSPAKCKNLLRKESESDPIVIVPAQGENQSTERLQQQTPDVTFLDASKTYPASSSSSAVGSPLKRAKLVRPTVTSNSALQIYSHRESSIKTSVALVGNLNIDGEGEQPARPYSSSDFEIGTESSNAGGSTMADALTGGRYNPVIEVGETSSFSTEPPPRDIGKPEPLKNSSRSMLKEYFAKADPVELLRGQATIALAEDQISSILRVVADEYTRASYDMLENLVYRASRLSLGTPITGKRVSKQSSVGADPKPKLVGYQWRYTK